MKKIAALILILCLIPINAVLGNVADTVEFIENGGFETIGSGEPSNWSYGKGKYSVNYTLDTSNPYSGNSCMNLYADSVDLYIYQHVYGIVSKSEYNISFYVRPIAYSGSNLSVKFEYYSVGASGESIYLSEYTEKFTALKNGTWQKISFKVIAPENSYSANILFRLPYSSGEIYYDDISVIGPSSSEYVPNIDPETIPVPEVKEMTQGASELITNGNVETLNSSGVPVGWGSATGGFNGNYVSVSDTVFRGDTGHSIKTSTKEENNPFATYLVKNLTPYCEYQLSFWLRVHLLNGKGVGIKYEYLNSANITIGSGTSSYSKVVTGANWMNFVSLFNPPDNCTAVRILFRLYGTGTIFFDDVSCYKTEEPYYISLEADNGFYYTENEEGLATAKANLYSYPDLVNKNIEFKLVYKGNAVVTQNIPINSEGKAEFRFKMAAMVNKREEYNIKATVLNVTGNNSESIPVYKYDRPKKLDSDGNYIIDGKIFNPVFLYHVDTDDYPKVKEAGINVVQGNASKSVLDAAYQNGLKVIVCLYNNLPAGHPANVSATQKSVTELMNHPAVFAWGIMDEPFSNDPGSEPYLLNSYKIIRDIDTVHPVYVMEDGNNFAIAAKYTDILGIDPYPSSSNIPTTHVATRTKRAFESCKKPIYNLLQAFSYNGYFPSTDELRNMIYQAFWEGSKAIGYYAFSESYGSIPLDKTVLWETMTKWYESESKLAFEHFVSNENILISENEGENAWWRTWQSDGETYALILNRSNTESVTVNVPVRTQTYSKVKIVGGAEGADIKGIGNGYININVKAGGAPLLKLVNFEENKVYFYQGNVIPNTIEDGTYSIGCYLSEGTGGYIITSLCKSENNIKEDIQIYAFDKVNAVEARFYEKEITLSNLENKKYELKTFLWNSSLKFLSPL